MSNIEKMLNIEQGVYGVEKGVYTSINLYVWIEKKSVWIEPGNNYVFNSEPLSLMITKSKNKKSKTNTNRRFLSAEGSQSQSDHAIPYTAS